MKELPKIINSKNELEELLSLPEKETVAFFKKLEGDIIFLGIGGKIGPSLANMAVHACNLAGVKKKVYGVSRFSKLEEKKLIESFGIETIQGDLLDRNFLESLPKVKNVFYLAGMKFGSEENQSLTWAMNSYLPGLVAEYYKDSCIVAYSTGCVYPLVSLQSGGSKETDNPNPVGEYAQSCLGRERMFEYVSRKHKTPVVLIRLNYAVELRYGVLLDVALKIKNNIPVDLEMGYFNVIWQGDANNQVLRSLAITKSPAAVLNISGSDILSVQNLALEFGKFLGKEVKFIGKEASTALLNNTTKAIDLFGSPKVPVEKVIKWIASWVQNENKVLGKPTYFEVRDGKY